jgi:crotonobetaine/carnitine-CoA ligase
MTEAPMILPPDRFAPNAVARWARETPDAVAIDHVGGAACTYAELAATMRHWAESLTALGVSAGAHVASFLPNGAMAQYAMLSLGLLRAVEVPVNAAFTGRVLHYILENSDAVLLLTTVAQYERVQALADALPRLGCVVLLDGEAPSAEARWRIAGRSAFLAARAKLPDDAGPVYRDIAALMYTSGTTGPSKGVLMPWAVIYQIAEWYPAAMLGPGDGIYSPLPLAHNSGRNCFNYALAAGARFVCRERFSGAAFWDDVRRHRCRVATLVGPMTQYLQAQPVRSDDADNPLETVICGPLIPEIDTFRTRFGVRILTCYGMTETGIVITTDDPAVPWQSCGRVRAGYPHVDLRIVNEHDEPLPAGAIGELVVRAEAPWSLNAGYYRQPETTAAAWRNGWFHTGDAFRRDADGWFYLVDRMKDAIRRRGENISSYEVESLVRDCPGIRDCAAIAVPARFGEDEILAVVEVDDPGAFDAPGFFAFLAPRMPGFMLPRYVEPVRALPRNETSLRVRKFELRARGLPTGAVDREAL